MMGTTTAITFDEGELAGGGGTKHTPVTIVVALDPTQFSALICIK